MKAGFPPKELAPDKVLASSSRHVRALKLVTRVCNCRTSRHSRMLESRTEILLSSVRSLDRRMLVRGVHEWPPCLPFDRDTCCDAVGDTGNSGETEKTAPKTADIRQFGKIVRNSLSPPPKSQKVVAAGIHTISELRDREAASARSSAHDQLCARPAHFTRKRARDPVRRKAFRAARFRRFALSAERLTIAQTRTSIPMHPRAQKEAARLGPAGLGLRHSQRRSGGGLQ